MSDIFLTIISTLGFMTVYNQIDAGTRKNMAEKKSLSAVRRNTPQIIYICLILLLLRVLHSNAPVDTFWVFINLQVIIMVYSTILVPTLAGFIVVQLFGTLMFISDGAMTWITTPIYLLTMIIVYNIRWYQSYLKKHPFFYLGLPIIVGTLFWTVAYHMAGQHALSVSGTCVNLFAFIWSYLALLDYDQYQQKDQRILAKLNHEVQYDGLTQARNWPMFQYDFNEHYARLAKSPNLVLITLDIDHFKSINDQYGHLAGNQVLITISTKVQHYLQSKNLNYQFYRTGGEEFAIILPDTKRIRAEEILFGCQKVIRDTQVQQDDTVIRITASFGMAVARSKDGSSTAVFKRADHYLYQSKHHGRDCVTIEGQSIK